MFSYENVENSLQSVIVYEFLFKVQLPIPTTSLVLKFDRPSGQADQPLVEAGQLPAWPQSHCTEVMFSLQFFIYILHR